MLIIIFFMIISETFSQSVDCDWNGIPLYGKVKVVNHNGDIKVRVVSSFEDLRVKIVENFADDCGEWIFVNHNEDFTIEFVNHHEDLRIKFVKNFPGMKR